MRKICTTSTVYLSPCASYKEKLIETAVVPMLDSILKDNALPGDWTGKRVTVKPNLLSKNRPDAGVTSNPVLIKTVAAYFVSRGAAVTIADSPGGLYHPTLLTSIYKMTGMESAANATGATLNLDTGAVQSGNFSILRPIAEADLVVGVGRLKTHSLCDMTAAVKNMFGAIPGLQKAEYHAKHPQKSDFCTMLVDLCAEVAPQVNIIDAVVAMEGNGPAGGTLKRVGALVGSANPFALDVLCASMMGYAPTEIETVRVAAGRALCPSTLSDLQIIGANPAKYTSKFKRPDATKNGRTGLWQMLPGTLSSHFFKPRERRPVIQLKKCIGCGECARCCPAETIEIIDKKAFIHREACIKCYCCQELCPKHAIDSK